MSHSVKKNCGGSITVLGGKGRGVKAWKRAYNKEIRKQFKDPDFVFSSAKKNTLGDKWGPKDGHHLYFVSRKEAKRLGWEDLYDKLLRK